MRSMKDGILSSVAGTVQRSIREAVVRTAEPAIRSAIDRAVGQLSAPLRRELDRLVDVALRRTTEKTGEATRPRNNRR